MELKPGDNRGPGKDDDEPEGDYTPSWIWLVSPNATNRRRTASGAEAISEEEFDDSMRVEWAKTSARVDRWEEEIDLLLGEMERTLDFLEWKANDWELKRTSRKDASPDIDRGLIAYANKQIAVDRHIAGSFAKAWLPVLQSNSIDHAWLMQHLPESSSESLPQPEDTSLTPNNHIPSHASNHHLPSLSIVDTNSDHENENSDDDDDNNNDRMNITTAMNDGGEDSDLDLDCS